MALLTLKVLLLACRLHLPFLAPLISMHVSVLCYQGHEESPYAARFAKGRGDKIEASSVKDSPRYARC